MSSGSARSILQRLDARPVRLREEEASVPLQEISLRRSGRYQVLGQIAVGGVGQVLKGRDLDLGREVALKLLRDSHAQDPEILRRFVEEAQIGGQLQHPGIVPIHEIALHEDGRPFFAMKLIKGRTLSAILHDRKDPSEGRRRHLDIFLQVCQTLAYAHSRGVIHRDLKPSNVMVGAFREVQVLDWGFAKVLAQGGVADERRARLAQSDMTRIATVRSAEDGSQSVAGSVMGTPAYMPPEQALGHVEELDERSDVFSLGAILCEILTGLPAYAGAPEDLLVLASQGRVEDAYARLDRCGCDPELAALAKGCLSPLRQGRPRNAGNVAEGVARHLADAEERAQRSKLAALEARREAARKSAEAAEKRAEAERAGLAADEQRRKVARAQARAEEAQARADEERRGRRQTLAIAATLAVVVACGGLGYGWVQSNRRDRQAETAAKVGATLQEARRLKGERHWAGALTAAEAAAELARDADEHARGLALAALEEIRSAKTAAEEAAARDEDNRALLATLGEVRFRHGAAFDPAETDASYGAALRAHGIDLGSLGPAEAGKRIAARGEVAAGVAAALDDWAWLRRTLGLEWSTMAAAAQAADPDRTRARIREAVGRRDALIRLAAELEPRDTPTRSLELLGTYLLEAAGPDEAVDLLGALQRWHPESSYLNHRMGLALLQESPPRRSRAAGFFKAALVGHPESKALVRAIRDTLEGSSDLDAFRGEVGYDDGQTWFSFDLRHSVITGTRRRIFVDKGAITSALVEHAGGREWTASSMAFPDHTVFIAQNLNEAGNVLETEALRIRSDSTPEFLLFDPEGHSVNLVEREDAVPQYRQTSAPEDCRRCHLAKEGNYSDPMMSFPMEPAELQVELPEDYRDRELVVRFLEAYHRGGRVFGPYGAIWLAKLKADAAAGRLAPEDRDHYERLKAKYPDILGP